MAKLCPAFSICPLIDQQCFLDIRQDHLLENIIVTMGRSIVMRFRLVDQKQISSWTCQDKLSAAVVYDEDRLCYVGVFNDCYLASWTCSKDLKKLRKKKLPCPIQDIHTIPGSRPIFVFRNGEISTLDRSGDTLTSVAECYIPPGSTVVRSDVSLLKGSWHLVVLVEGPSDCTLNFIPLNRNEGFSFSMNRSSETLGSYTISGDALVSVWSDGLWIQNPVSPKGFPGRRIGLLEGMDCSRSGAAAPAGEGLVALAGLATGGEGACVCLLDVSRGLVAAAARLKVLPSKPRLWVNDSWLLLPTGPSLTVVPFVRAAPRLDSLLGAAAAAAPPVVRSTWEGSAQEVPKCTKTDSLSEFAIAQLEVKKMLDARTLSQAVQYLVEIDDAPDSCVVDTLAALINDSEPKIEDILKLMEVPIVGDIDTQKMVRSQLGEEAALKLLEVVARAELTSGRILWSSILLDAFYQHLLLGGQSEVRSLLNQLQERVTVEREEVRAARELCSCLTAFYNRPPSHSPLSVQYAVDKLSLY